MIFQAIVYICSILLIALSLFPLMVFIENLIIGYWVKNHCRLNIWAEAVIILPSVDWRNPVAWLKPNFHLDDIKTVVCFASRRRKRVSVYLGPGYKMIESVMADKSIKEVYFVGHGGSHFFRSGTDEVLCYCLFNDRLKFEKDFVHQVHCGTTYGQSLIDYVVPEVNRGRCFFSPGQINSGFIEKEFKRLSSIV